MNKLVIVFVLLMSQFFSSYAQENEKLIESFFEDIFVSKSSTPKELYKTYIFKNCKKIKGEKVKVFEANIEHLKSLNTSILNQDSILFNVNKYRNSEFKDLLPLDEKSLDNIFVVSVDKTIVTYVLMKENKIEAFNTIRKGKEGPAFFFSDFN